jgi:predicted DNA-binding ribbon-helix-helix protein
VPRHLIKRSFRLTGHATSVAQENDQSLAGLVVSVDEARAARGLPLASALRLAALTHARGR